MEKDIKTLHAGLGRSKFAIFLIIAFLALLTYIVIVVASEVTNQQAFNIAPQAYEKTAMMEEQTELEEVDPIEPGTPAEPATCENYEEYVETMKRYINELRQDLACEPQPPGYKPEPTSGIMPESGMTEPQTPQVIIPETSCQRLWATETYLNGLTEFMARICAYCPLDANDPIGPDNPADINEPIGPDPGSGEVPIEPVVPNSSL